MHRIKTLPKLFTDWIADHDRTYIHEQLEKGIIRRTGKSGTDINDLNLLERQITEFDQKYYDLQETDKNQSMLNFFTARLLSAAQCLKSGQLDDALYEYFHSFSSDNPEDIIKDLEST